MKTQLSDDETAILDYYRTLPKDRQTSLMSAAMGTQLSEDEMAILDYCLTLPKDRQTSFRREIIFLKNTGKIPQAWKQAGFMEPTGGRYE